MNATIYTFSIPCEAEESMGPYLAVKVGTATATARKVLLSDAGEKVIGIITSTNPSSTSGTTTAAAGDVVNVVTQDGAIVPCTVNGASVNIVAGDFLKSAANGVLVKAATAGDYVCAIALQPATTDGVKIDVMIKTTRIPA